MINSSFLFLGLLLSGGYSFWQVMSMIPGFNQELMPKGREKESQAKVKKFMTMMDSMTDEGIFVSVCLGALKPHVVSVELVCVFVFLLSNFVFTEFNDAMGLV